MDYFARVQEGDEEGEQRAEEQVSHWQKVERTFGWLTRYRRLARDYESLLQSSEAFIQIASIRLDLDSLDSFPFPCNLIPTRSKDTYSIRQPEDTCSIGQHPLLSDNHTHQSQSLLYWDAW